jgi:hypothetical protein
MNKIISKFGSSQVLMFDAAPVELVRQKAEDQVNIKAHAGGTITNVRT